MLSLCLLLLIVLSSAHLQYDDDYDDDLDSLTSHQIGLRQFRRPLRPSHRGDFDPQRFLRRPRQKHTDPEQLKELLGDNFDPQWMSITKPKILVEPPEDEIPENRFQVSRLRKQFAQINLTDELREAGVSEDPKILEGIGKWFFKRALCPLVYRWEDMSPYFWPPYIKHGECLERHQFCSWPVSMHCVPASSTTLTVLRWQCRERKRKGKGKRPNQDNIHPRNNERRKIRIKCEWVKSNFPVTSECMCAC